MTKCLIATIYYFLPDLYRIYTLLSRIPEGLDPLKEKFEGHVKREGLAAVEKVAGDGETLVSKNRVPGERETFY